MRPSRGGLALATLVVLAGVLVWRGRAGRHEPRGGGAVVAAEVALEDEDFAPYLAVAHAIATHGEVPATAPPPRRGARVFVTAWIAGREPIRATARGATLFDSVTAASGAIAATVSPGTSLRVEIEVPVAEQLADVMSHMEIGQYDVGLYGYLATGEGGKVGFLLPDEVVDEHVARSSARDGGVALKGDMIMETLAERAGVEMTMLAPMRTTRFRVVARVEGAAPGEPPLALFRGRPPRPKEMSAQDLLSAVRAGASYLTRSLDESGRFVYRYDPAADEVEKGYDMLRHAGAIYALMEAYGELGVPEWKDAAKLAIVHLKEQVKTTSAGATFSSGGSGEQQKVGANGLGLVALTEYARATKDMMELPLMQELGKLIVHQQYPDGHFRANEDVMREDESAKDVELKKEVSYYAGEATLGLVRLYSIDPNPAWLSAARRAADYLVNVRDAPADLEHQIHDHWLSYALHDLYVLTKEPSYAKHAHKIADAIAWGEKTAATAPYPDYVGAFYDEGESTPTSTRLEALASTLQLTRYMGGDETKLRVLASELACFIRGQQIDEESAFFARSPSRALGGVQRSLVRTDIRIDYVQHAMSGWLRLARLLRDPAWGKGS